MLAMRALDLSQVHKERGWEALCPPPPRRHRRAGRSPSAITRPRPTTSRLRHSRQSSRMRPLQAHCHLGLGTLYAKTGQREQAHAALSTAIELYRAMDMTFWLPQAEAALAQVEGR